MPTAKIAEIANDDESPRQNFSSPPEGRAGKRKSFRASDLKRAIKTLQAVGINAVRVEIEPDGKIIVVSSAISTGTQDASLDNWLAHYARSA
jgi:uncharacterized lipoprotein YddW (UPF0748 family)